MWSQCSSCHASLTGPRSLWALSSVSLFLSTLSDGGPRVLQAAMKVLLFVYLWLSQGGFQTSRRTCGFPTSTHPAYDFTLQTLAKTLLAGLNRFCLFFPSNNYPTTCLTHVPTTFVYSWSHLSKTSTLGYLATFPSEPQHEKVCVIQGMTLCFGNRTTKGSLCWRTGLFWRCLSLASSPSPACLWISHWLSLSWRYPSSFGFEHFWESELPVWHSTTQSTSEILVE